MKVQELPAEVKAVLLRLLAAPECAIVYHGSGIGDALRARLVSWNWAERAQVDGKAACG